MHSSISYSELNAEETSNGYERRSSLQYIPDGGVKRTLMLFALICGTIITFIYMRQVPRQSPYNSLNNYYRIYNEPTTSANSKSSDLLGIELSAESSKPSWTWSCEQASNYKRCVRTLAKETSEIQSLKTCNMVCSETPIWPLPTGKSLFGKSVILIAMQDISLNIVKSPSKEVTKYLQEAFALMIADIHNIEPMKHDKEAITMHIKDENAKGIKVRVAVTNDTDPRLKLDTKENYTLQMESDEHKLIVDIHAESFCGARHGFETLTQLVWFDDNLKSVVALDKANVEDAPKFRYRGLLLDTARQYFPVQDILRTIDAMAASKLNTFHWHATDSQSFPLKLKSVPQMALYGAYSPKQVYNTDDIKMIVHRARVRGIRVVIEIDAPAHIGRAWSWGNSSGLGELAYCVEEDPWQCGEPPCGQLNPLNEHVFEILEKIYTEILELTGVDDVYHLGGDEVNRHCWQKYLNGEDIMDTWYKFMQKVRTVLKKANHGNLPELTILWSSKLTTGSNLNRMKDVTIQLWGGSSWPAMIQTAKVARTIISHVNAWYLDCGFGQWLTTGACQPYRKWQEVYNHRPWEGRSDWQVQGGTACMWTEQLAPEGVDSRIWPRGSAIAERLWSDPEKTTKELNLRIDMQRNRLVERGIRAEPIWPRWCSDNPYECF